MFFAGLSVSIYTTDGFCFWSFLFSSIAAISFELSDETVSAARAHLPAKTSDVLKMVCGIGCEPKSALAVSRLLGVSHQAVQYHLAQARKRLLRTPAFLRWVRKEYGFFLPGEAS